MHDARESIIIINGQILRPVRIRRKDLSLPFPANNKSLLIIRTASIGLIDRFGINQSVARSRKVQLCQRCNNVDWEILRDLRENSPFYR